MGSIGHALALAGSMTWEILWALILGFTLSAVVRAVVRRHTVVRLLGHDRPKTLAVAATLGAASSSCSYAAIALVRSLFRKGASFGAAMAFEIGSNHLVVELGVILAMVLAGYAIEIIFGATSLIPTSRNATPVMEAHISWNYTTWLNIAFLVLTAVLVTVTEETEESDGGSHTGGHSGHAHH